MSTAEYDVIVVGAGMFGSSAAKHVRQLQPSLRVAVVGPASNDGPLARGQHFDEARICRRVETMAPWAHLNDLGALSYRATEAASGVRFYTPCGVVWVGTAADRAASVGCMEAVVRASGGADAVSYAVVTEDGAAGDAAAAAAVAAGKTSVLRVTTSSSVAEGVFGGGIRVGQLAVDGETTHYVVESGAAGGGTVHPTRYVEAQLACAAAVAPASHYTHVREVVVRIARVDGDGSAAYDVTTDAGHVYRAARVLVATACFAGYHKLVPDAVSAKVDPYPQFVVLLRVDPPHGEDHEANVKASEACPSIIRTTGRTDDEKIYTLPPRYYSDRKGWYVKMGRAGAPAKAVGAVERHTLAGAMAWFDEGKELSPTEPCVQYMASVLSGMYTDWPLVKGYDAQNPSHFSIVRCMKESTPTHLPYVDCVDGAGLYCALGGCGRGAKACDPIGCVAAHRLLGVELPPEYEAVKDLFRLSNEAEPGTSYY